MLTAAILIAVSQFACAQFAGGATPNAGPVMVPGAQIVGPQQLTPQQALGIAQMRALARGRGQVRTGYPQYIPMGPQNMMGAPAAPAADMQQASSSKTSTQKRIEARQAREEQKRAAREDAKAKAAKGKNANGKNVKAKNAKVAKTANAKPAAQN